MKLLKNVMKEKRSELIMNKEIKQILDKATPYLFGDEVDKLLDYITNLQKKYENAVADYELEKYKNIKAISWTNRIIEIIKQQPSKDDTLLKEKLELIEEIDRLNNIIDGLEKDLNEAYDELHRGELVNGRELINNIYQELKELKENNK